MSIQLKQRSVLPGFGLTMGFTLFYLSFLVLIPLAGLVFKSTTIDWHQFCAAVTEPTVVASYKLTFGASLVAALINAFFGLIVAWVLVRYPFPGRNVVDALVDLPFAMPTAVSGIALTAIYAQNGWIGQYLKPLGIHVAYTPLGHHGRADVHRSAVRGANACSRRWKTWTPRSRRPRPALAPHDCRRFLARDPPDDLAGPADRLSPWPSPGRWASTARSFSSRAISR